MAPKGRFISHLRFGKIISKRCQCDLIKVKTSQIENPSL